MKKLLILSGKGGTGKTTTAAAFIHFSEAQAFADCDVDAPNLHLVISRQEQSQNFDYIGSKKATIDEKSCINCSKCMDVCRFSAIEKANNHFKIDEYACEGCGVCERICPTHAILLKDDIAGRVSLYDGNSIFTTAELKMGRGNSGKLVSEVKQTLITAAKHAPIAVIDGSPGIGCPVIASMSGVDLVLIVTEPSMSGLSDLTRIIKTANIFKTRVAVCVNKWDSSPVNAKKIEQFCCQQNIPFVGYIPYDKQAASAVNQGKSLAELESPASVALQQIFKCTMKILEDTDNEN